MSARVTENPFSPNFGCSGLNRATNTDNTNVGVINKRVYLNPRRQRRLFVLKKQYL